MIVGLSVVAAADVRAIHAHIAEDSPRAAQRVEDALLAAMARLADFPYMGRLTSAADVRELVTVRPYIIVYRFLPDLLRIERVWHGAQDR